MEVHIFSVEFTFSDVYDDERRENIDAEALIFSAEFSFSNIQDHKGWENVDEGDTRAHTFSAELPF